MDILLPSNAVLRVKRTTRKDSVALKVTHEDNHLLVPRGYGQQKIQRFVKEHLDWIEATIQQNRLFLPEMPLPEDASRVRRFGQDFEICFDEAVVHCQWQPENCRVLVPKSLQNQPGLVKFELKKALNHESDLYLRQRVEALAEQMALSSQVREIIVKDYKSRWGSCTHDGRVSLNWRLIFFAPEVIDYVVIHELAHLIHLNHSQDFWGEVARFCPAYKRHKTTLKQQAALAMNF